jgi:thiamine kinase-like enzyme
MTPDSALATIPGFSNAIIGLELANGPTNQTVLLEHFEAKYVLRVDKPLAKDLGLDRHAEEAICRMVAAAGFAPELVYMDHSRGVSLRRFVAGTNWLESDLRNAGWLKRLAALLRKLHALPAVESVFNPAAAVSAYAEKIGSSEAKELESEALSLLEACRAVQTETCLCHNDLLNYNILESDSVMLIDWEYAGMGDPWFDLAIVVQHHDLGDKLGAHSLLKLWKLRLEVA